MSEKIISLSYYATNSVKYIHTVEYIVTTERSGKLLLYNEKNNEFKTIPKSNVINRKHLDHNYNILILTTDNTCEKKWIGWCYESDLNTIIKKLDVLVEKTILDNINDLNNILKHLKN